MCCDILFRKRLARRIPAAPIPSRPSVRDPTHLNPLPSKIWSRRGYKTWRLRWPEFPSPASPATGVPSPLPLDSNSNPIPPPPTTTTPPLLPSLAPPASPSKWLRQSSPWTASPRPRSSPATSPRDGSTSSRSTPSAMPLLFWRSWGARSRRDGPAPSSPASARWRASPSCFLCSFSQPMLTLYYFHCAVVVNYLWPR